MDNFITSFVNKFKQNLEERREAIKESIIVAKRLTRRSIVKFLDRECLVVYQSDTCEAKRLCRIIGYDEDLNLVFSEPGHSRQILPMRSVVRVVYKKIKFIPLGNFIKGTISIDGHITNVIETIMGMSEYDIFTRRYHTIQNGSFDRTKFKPSQLCSALYDWFNPPDLLKRIAPIALINIDGEAFAFCIDNYKFALFDKDFRPLDSTHQNSNIQKLISLVGDKNNLLDTHSWNGILSQLNF